MEDSKGADLFDELWSVLQQQLPTRQPVQRIDGEHSIPAHIGVPVLQAGQDGGYQRLQDLLLPDSAQEAQGDAPDVLVGVLQVVAQILADQNLQATSGRTSVNDFIVILECVLTMLTALIRMHPHIAYTVQDGALNTPSLEAACRWHPSSQWSPAGHYRGTSLTSFRVRA